MNCRCLHPHQPPRSPHVCTVITSVKKSMITLTTSNILTRGVPNSGFRIFGRIQILIVLWTIRPNKNTNSVVGWEFWRCTCCSDIYHLLMSLAIITAAPACCLAMTLSPSFVFHNQAVWAIAAGTDWVKSAVDVTSCTIHVQTNYSYSFWRHYSSQYEYTIPSTIRHRSEYEANIQNIPNPNPLWRTSTVVNPQWQLRRSVPVSLIQSTDNLIYLHWWP